MCILYKYGFQWDPEPDQRCLEAPPRAAYLPAGRVTREDQRVGKWLEVSAGT